MLNPKGIESKQGVGVGSRIPPGHDSKRLGPSPQSTSVRLLYRFTWASLDRERAGRQGSQMAPKIPTPWWEDPAQPFPLSAGKTEKLMGF